MITMVYDINVGLVSTRRSVVLSQKTMSLLVSQRNLHRILQGLKSA